MWCSAVRVTSDRCVCVHPEFFQSKCTCGPSRLGTEVTGPLNLVLVFWLLFFFWFLLWSFFLVVFFFRFYFAPLYWAQYCEWMRCDFGGNVKHEKCSYFLDTCCLVQICIPLHCVSIDWDNSIPQSWWLFFKMEINLWCKYWPLSVVLLTTATTMNRKCLNLWH